MEKGVAAAAAALASAAATATSRSRMPTVMSRGQNGLDEDAVPKLPLAHLVGGPGLHGRMFRLCDLEPEWLRVVI